MIDYGKKDVEDTRALWYDIKDHVKPKLNMATFLQKRVCISCGSKDVIRNGTRVLGKTRYQKFHCNGHGGYAGRAPISKTGVIGTMG